MQRLVLQEANGSGRFELRRLGGVSGERALLLVDEAASPSGTSQAAFQLNVSEARVVLQWLAAFCAGATTEPAADDVLQWDDEGVPCTSK